MRRHHQDAACRMEEYITAPGISTITTIQQSDASYQEFGDHYSILAPSNLKRKKKKNSTSLSLVTLSLFFQLVFWYNSPLPPKKIRLIVISKSLCIISMWWFILQIAKIRNIIFFPDLGWLGLFCYTIQEPANYFSAICSTKTKILVIFSIG